MQNYRDELENKLIPDQQPSPCFEIDSPEVVTSDFHLGNPHIHITGMNGALHRFPGVQSQATTLLPPGGFIPTWKPYWPKLKTFGLTFPAGIDFLPVAEEKTSDTNLQDIQAPKSSTGDGKSAVQWR